MQPELSVSFLSILPPEIGSRLLPLAGPVGDVPAEGSFGRLLFYIGIALGFSFLCSVLEAVLLSSSRSHLEVLVQQGKRAGRIMKGFKEDVETPISAILTLNTIAHTAGSAFAGAEAAALYGEERVGVITAVLTFLILVFSEIIPKTLGANYWKQLTPLSAYTIRLIVFVLYPIVWLLNLLTGLLGPKHEEPLVSRIELQVLAGLSRSEGSIGEREHRIVENLLRLEGVKVRDVLTPRIVVFALQQDMPVSEVLAEHTPMRYSRIPIFGDDLDDVRGYVLRYDIIRAGADGDGDKQLHEMARPLLSIPETVTVAQALDDFGTQREHIFQVVDEYGGTAGILTLEDSIETLLGVEITDESDLVEDLRQLAKLRYESRMEQDGVVSEEKDET